MAVIIPATTTDYLQRTTSLLAPGSATTVMMWVKYAAIPVSPAYQLAYALLDNPAVYVDFVTLDSNNLQHNHAAFPGADINSASVSASTWYHLAWVQTGNGGAANGQRLYVNGVSVGTTVKNRAAFTVAFEMLGNDTFASGDCQIAFFRSWQRALSQANIQTEMVSGRAVSQTLLWMDTPLVTNGLDQSGNSRDWTEIGSVTYSDTADPLPANGSIFTATDMTALPYATTQDVDSGDIPYSVYYKYTAVTGENTVNVWGYGGTPLAGYQPVTYVWVLSGGIQTAYSTVMNSSSFADSFPNTPVQISVVAGTTYYFEFADISGGTVSPADLQVSGVTGPDPTTDAPPGSIFVPDDVIGFGAAFLSSVDADDQNVLKFLVPFPAGEGTDTVISNNRILTTDDANDAVVLYESDLTTVVVSIPFAPASANLPVMVRSNLATSTFYTWQFYNGVSVFPVIKVVDDAGTVTNTITLSGSKLLSMLAPSLDDSVLYISKQETLSNSAISTWNVAGAAYGADLVAAITNYQLRDLLTLTDGTLVALYKHFSPDGVSAIRYSAAGATLNTYSLYTGTLPSITFGYRLASALDDPTSFWAWFHIGDTDSPIGAGGSRFQNIQTSDGTVLSSIDYTEYGGGHYEQPQTDTPVRVGPSSSCSFVILRVGETPPIVHPPEEFLIRRERWFPVINQENQRMTFSSLQIDLQAGNGLTVGQGENPLLELDWSDDSGWTWSNIRFLPTGRIGQYNRRAIARVLGQSRQRVFRIAVSDPCQFVILDGYMQVKGGTS